MSEKKKTAFEQAQQEKQAGIVKEFFLFLRYNKKYWMIPIVITLLALAVLVHQPTPRTVDFTPLPVYSLARLPANYYAGPDECELCRQGIPLERISAEPLAKVLKTPVTAGAF